VARIGYRQQHRDGKGMDLPVFPVAFYG